MGFFSGLTGGQTTTTPATGYYNLPSDLKAQYSTAYNAIPGATSVANFTPPEFNADQLQAFGNVRNTANWGPSDIMNLVQKYQNPFDQSVIDSINRESVGQYSQVKQGLNEAGQMGSNRSLLGANDVDLTRLNQIGTFKQSQFNNSLNTGLLQNQQNINNLLGIGGQQQEREWGVQQAPYNALSAQFGLLNPVVDYMGNSRQSQTVKTGGGLGGLLGGLSGIANIGSGLGSLGSGTGFFGGGFGLDALNQSVGSYFSPSPMGPYQGIY